MKLQTVLLLAGTGGGLSLVLVVSPFMNLNSLLTGSVPSVLPPLLSLSRWVALLTFRVEFYTRGDKFQLFCV